MKKVNKASAPDDENPTLTEKDFARAKRAEDIPALAHLVKRRPGERGPQRAPKKMPVSLRLDPKVIDAFKKTGAGWQSRMNDALVKAAKKLPA